MSERSKLFASQLHLDYHLRMNETCDALKLLTESRLSRTPHRIAVLNLLIGAERILSAGEIAEEVMKSGQGINRVTVYRMLTAFKNAGIIREVTTDQGIRHYEMACIHNPVHPHFFCVKCRTLECLSSLPESEIAGLFKGGRFKIDSISINISGVCARCRGKK